MPKEVSESQTGGQQKGPCHKRVSKLAKRPDSYGDSKPQAPKLLEKN